MVVKNYEFLIPVKDGYVFVDGKLQEFNPKSCFVKVVDGIAIPQIDALVGGVEITLVNPDVYADEADYKEKRNNYRDSNFFCVNSYLLFNNIRRRHENIDKLIVKDDSTGYKEISVDDVTFTFNIDSSMGEIVYNSIKPLCGDLYATTEDFYKFNDLVVVDKNGEKRIVKCEKSLFALEDDQKMLIDEFRSLIKKLGEAGIFAYYDNEDMEIGFLSHRNVSKMYTSYEDEPEEENGEVCNCYTRYAETVSFCDYSNCDYKLQYVRK